MPLDNWEAPAAYQNFNSDSFCTTSKKSFGIQLWVPCNKRCFMVPQKCGLNSAKMTLLWWKYKDYSNLKRKIIWRKNILKISLKGIKTLPHTTQPHCKNSHSIKKDTEMLSQGGMCTWIRLERIFIATRKRFGCYTSLPLKVGNCTLSVRACIWIPRKSVRK